MHDLRDASSDTLKQLLSTTYPKPELGARLKQRLNAALIANGQGVFTERSLGFAKFSDYLQQVHGDLLTIERREGSGDIFVSLRTPPVARNFLAPSLSQPKVPIIRSAVWQAFANPDPERKRFINRHSGEVLHYREGTERPEQAEIEASPQNYVEISPITGMLQATWMRDFLGRVLLPSNEKEALKPLITEAYSSAVNATFTRALGVHSTAWRSYRTAQITDIITRWANEASVPADLLHVEQSASSTETLRTASRCNSETTATTTCTPINPEQLSARQQIVKLLDLLTDEDLSRLVLPTLLSTLMIKSRL